MLLQLQPFKPNAKSRSYLQAVDCSAAAIVSSNHSYFICEPYSQFKSSMHYAMDLRRLLLFLSSHVVLGSEIGSRWQLAPIPQKGANATPATELEIRVTKGLGSKVPLGAISKGLLGQKTPHAC